MTSWILLPHTAPECHMTRSPLSRDQKDTEPYWFNGYPAKQVNFSFVYWMYIHRIRLPFFSNRNHLKMLYLWGENRFFCHLAIATRVCTVHPKSRIVFRQLYFVQQLCPMTTVRGSFTVAMICLNRATSSRDASVTSLSLPSVHLEEAWIHVVNPSRRTNR